MASPVAHPEPIATINITPMIDVMLVLIVMLILTIPVVTHKVPIELPPPGPASTPQSDPHRIEIAADGGLSWDGKAIADRALPGLLAGMMRDDPRAVLHMRTHPEARYDRFDHILATVKRANVTRLGFVGDAALAR